MADLSTRQQQLWQLLCETASKQPMLRLSRTDDCFWICDLPRRISDTAQIRTRLEAAGYSVTTGETDGLWHIDLSPTDVLYTPPAERPCLPQRSALHTLYALCRLLLAHPAPQEEQPMPLVRALMKLSVLEAEERNRQAVKLYSLCAERLNRRLALPFAACGLLVKTIQEEDAK